MSDPFIGEVKMFGCTFAPRGYAQCNGQILSIQQNQTLFAILGTNYGGNGTTTYALPNLQGTVPIGTGQGPGLTPRTTGQVLGSPSVTLTTAEMPAHSHVLTATSVSGTQASADGAQLARGLKGTFQSSTVGRMYSGSAADTQLHPLAVGLGGASVAHNNMMPFLTINFCIAIVGIFPSRN